MDRATVYGDNPAQQATLFAEAGAGFLHVVDLDGAFAGRAVNAGAVESIIEAFPGRSEEHTSELQSLMRISYAVFCLKKKNNQDLHTHTESLHRTNTQIRHPYQH